MQRAANLLLNLLFWLVLIITPKAAIAAVEISSDTQYINLEPALEFFHDQDETFHILKLLEAEGRQPWQAASARSPNAMAAGIYWLRAKIHNTGEQAITLTVETEHPSLEVVDLYRIHPDGGIDVIYSDVGIDAAFKERPNPYPSIIENIPFAPGVTTLVWRVESHPVVEFQASLWKPQTFFDKATTRQILFGMVYGALLVMSLYNLFLFVSTREKSYYYYVLFVLSAGYMLAADAGHLYQYVLPDQQWPKMAIYAAVYATNILLFAKFTLHFLNLTKRAPRMGLLIKYNAIVSAVTLLLIALTSNNVAVYFALASISTLYILALFAGIKVRTSGVISAGNFVVAILILVFALIASNMATMGLISYGDVTDSLDAIGITLMLVFFSLALGDRINQLQKDNIEANYGINRANEDKQKASRELVNSQMARVELEHQAAQARAESRAKSDFLATMSREIRPPVNGVMSLAEQLKDSALDPQQQQGVGAIEQSGKALLAIINDLRDYAEIEAGKMELQTSSFNLESLIDDCVSSFALKACDKDINLITDLDPTIEPVLRGDASKIKQIIINLLSNAFKFTDHGDIIFKINKTAKPGINSLELHFDVQDSGIGLTDDEQQRLFTPFSHGESHEQGRYGSSGLGLAISKQLAELMDGKIGVSSEPGKGANFWFTARLIIDETPDKCLLRDEPLRLAHHNVLIVDGNAASLNAIERTLRAWGMNTTVASSAQAAIDICQSNDSPFDMVLCDYRLDTLDGIELAKHLPPHSYIQGTYVLMAIARQLPNQDQLSDAGITLVLEKPITNALLREAALQAIDTQHQQEGENETIDGSHLQVLLVEDNQVNQLLTKAMLAKFGITPDISDDGVLAVEQYDKKDYDLILMDCEMPVLDGFEACKQIRSKEKLFNKEPTTIVAVSAHARSDFQQKALKAGMDYYLTKPLTHSSLVGVLKKISS